MDLSQLCEHAVVSRSGVYRWRRQAAYREFREWQDEQDFALIKQTYDYRGYAKGARGIQMRLLHMDPPVIMNIKKIRRLMKKIRFTMPYKKSQSLSKDVQGYEDKPCCTEYYQQRV